MTTTNNKFTPKTCWCSRLGQVPSPVSQARTGWDTCPALLCSSTIKNICSMVYHDPLTAQDLDSMQYHSNSNLINYLFSLKSSRPCRDLKPGLPRYQADMLPTELSWLGRNVKVCCFQFRSCSIVNVRCCRRLVMFIRSCKYSSKMKEHLNLKFKRK